MDNTDINQTLYVENRKKLIVDSVVNVGVFNEDYLELTTKLGCLCVEGCDLKIEELRQDESKIIVTGTISGLFYKENKSTKGFLSGIFK